LPRSPRKRWRANSAAKTPVAVVDADVGQSEIGPPGTVGVAWADANVARLHELKVAARFFVGAFAPVGVALEHAVATGQAAAWVRANGARRVLIDTTGFVAGPTARRLKLAKAQLIQPALVLGFGPPDGSKVVDRELDGLLAVVGASVGASVLVLPTPASVGRKSQTLRATRRMTRLGKTLDGAREIVLPLDSVATVGATLNTGEPIAPHLVRWAAQALRLPVVYGERLSGVLSLFAGGPARPGWENSVAPVAEHFGARTVRVLSLANQAGLLRRPP
jgi:polynucleotide 5'-hydroxyl-kinase GRC3/NOL9